jgi:hypothetical protein
MDKSAYDQWSGHGRPRDNRFADLMIEELRSSPAYDRIASLFGDPDETRGVGGGIECFYFYTLTVNNSTHEMFVYFSVIAGMVSDYCCNEKKNLWPKV